MFTNYCKLLFIIIINFLKLSFSWVLYIIQFSFIFILTEHNVDISTICLLPQCGNYKVCFLQQSEHFQNKVAFIKRTLPCYVYFHNIDISILWTFHIMYASTMWSCPWTPKWLYFHSLHSATCVFVQYMMQMVP